MSWSVIPFDFLELTSIHGVEANGAARPFVLRGAQIVEDAWEAVDLEAGHQYHIVFE